MVSDAIDFFKLVLGEVCETVRLMSGVVVPEIDVPRHWLVQFDDCSAGFSVVGGRDKV